MTTFRPNRKAAWRVWATASAGMCLSVSVAAQAQEPEVTAEAVSSSTAAGDPASTATERAPATSTPALPSDASPSSVNEAAAPRETPKPPGVTPPRLRRAAPAIYPAKAYADELEADVLIDVELNAQGHVVALTPTGLTLFWYDENNQLVEETITLDEDEWGFVASAEASFRTSTWTPAEMVDDRSPDGRAIPSVITRKVSFTYDDAVLEEDLLPSGDLDAQEGTLPDGAPSSDGALVDGTEPDGAEGLLAEHEAPVNFEGRLLERGTRKALSGMKISAFLEPEGPLVDAVTDTDGRFAFRGLPAGTWSILIDEDGFKPFEAQEAIADDDALVATYRVQREYFDAYYSQTVEDPPPREVTRRSLETTEIQRIPGTNNDAIRVVQNLPGVARAPFSGGDIIVRGSESSDSGFYIDGMPIPTLYHFGGLRAVIPTELVEKLDFYPGNFGVRYGRATAGVLEVETTMRLADKVGGHIDVNLFDTGLFLEAPLSKKLTLQLGFRRSYIDAVLLAAKSALPIKLTVAPRYYDYQARLLWNINARNKASLMFFGADDLVDLLLKDEEDIDPGVRGGMRASQNFHSALLRLDTKLSDRVTNTARALVGIQGVGISAGQDFYLNLDLVQLALRDEVAIRASENLTFRTGIDVQLTPGKVGVRLPRPPGEGQESVGFDAEEVVEVSERFTAFAPGAYVEADYRPIEDLQILPGLRFDYFGHLGRFSVDPRIGVRYQVSDLVALKGAVGSFHRAPDPNETIRGFGNPNLLLEHAIQYSLGAEFRFTDFLEFDVELFYKDLNQLVSPSNRIIQVDGQSAPEVYNNGGEGRVYGAEFFLRHQLANNFFGWVTYTVSRAERKDFGAEDWRLFDTDQTHILGLIASYNLPKNWTIGGRFRLVSGNLYTPIVGSTYDVETGTYIRVTGETNAARQALFHQLDVRVDKRWIFRDWSLTAYIDIQNIYNRQNPEGTAYSYDFSESARVTGLPFIPAIGIRGEF